MWKYPVRVSPKSAILQFESGVHTMDLKLSEAERNELVDMLCGLRDELSDAPLEQGTDGRIRDWYAPGSVDEKKANLIHDLLLRL